MNASQVISLRKQCDGPRDGALLRFALANALRDADDLPAAIEQFQRAVTFDPLYSAAWKLLGASCLAAGQHAAAANAWRSGIDAAMQRGDKQAEKEMTVFLRRLEKAQR